jgi:hypothetical protein
MGWEGPLTHRQLQAWNKWLDEQWNNPSRADWYQMQTSSEIARGHAKNPENVNPKKFKLKFEEPEKLIPPKKKKPKSSAEEWQDTTNTQENVVDNGKKDIPVQLTLAYMRNKMFKAKVGASFGIKIP